MFSDGIVLFAATTAERFFRIDQAQEHLHYATDIFSDELFIVYPEVNVEAAPASADVAVLSDRRRSHFDDTAEMSSVSAVSNISGHRPLHRINARRSISSPSKSSR